MKKYSNLKGDKIMNTYLVPVKEEYQSKFAFIVVVYANTEKEAYNAVIEWK